MTKGLCKETVFELDEFNFLQLVDNLLMNRELTDGMTATPLVDLKARLKSTALSTRETPGVAYVAPDIVGVIHRTHNINLLNIKGKEKALVQKVFEAMVLKDFNEGKISMGELSTIYRPGYRFNFNAEGQTIEVVVIGPINYTPDPVLFVRTLTDIRCPQNGKVIQPAGYRMTLELLQGVWRIARTQIQPGPRKV